MEILNTLDTLLRKLTWLSGKRRTEKEDEFRQELEFHLAEEAEEARASGLSDAQARLAARRDFGSIPIVIEDTRAAWGWLLLDQTVQDLRYAGRTLLRSPSFALAAVVTLGLGIGLTTAIFSVVHGVLRPLPFPESDRLVLLDTIVEGTAGTDGALSAPNFMSLYEEHPRAFTDTAGVLETEVTLTGAGDARRIATANVSAEFFDLFQVRPLLGRTFVHEENEAGRGRVVVLGHALWQQQFGGDAGIIGRIIPLDGVAHTVVGVMPPGFEFPYGRGLWVPLHYGRNYFSASSSAGRKNNRFVLVLGRLAPGVGLEAARSELAVLAKQLVDRFPEENAGVSFTARPLQDTLVGDVRAPLLLLLGAVGFVLVIAAANVAGLLLARATTRGSEIALRAALGAGRGRIVRQLVAESLFLGIGGGALGLLITSGVSGQLLAMQFEGLQRLGLADAVRLDGTVLMFALGVTLGSCLLAGVFPALRAADDGLASGLQPAGRSGMASHGSGRLRQALVICQLALSVVLLHGAGLLIHSFVRLTSVDPGFDTQQIVSFGLTLTGDYDSSAHIRTFFGDLLNGIRQQPGVVSAGAISRIPIGRQGAFTSRFRLEGQTSGDEPSIGVRVVTPEYFSTIGMRVLRGRGITEADRTGGAPVVAINEAAAARFFPGANPLGHQLRSFTYDPIEAAAEAFTVVGVVADVRSRGLDREPQPEAYFAHAQVPVPQMAVLVRTAGTPLVLANAIRREVRARDPNLPVVEVRTMEQVLNDSVSRPRFFTTLLGIFSGVALLLAGVGIFGLLSFSVARRTREIGIRMALGASPAALVRSIVRETSMLVVCGLGIGLAGALALTRLLAGQLFELKPTDPVTLAGVVLTLAATALLASFVPARRAAVVDPLIALRAE